MRISDVDNNVRGKYYRMRKQIMSGITGKSDLIKLVELYGSESRESIIRNNRNLRIALHKRGVCYEDCFYATLNRENGLNGLKGFYRMEKRVSDNKVKRVIGKCWEDERKGHLVAVVESVYGRMLNEYIREKMLKDIVEGKYGGKKLVCSKGWKIIE